MRARDDERRRLIYSLAQLLGGIKGLARRAEIDRANLSKWLHGQPTTMAVHNVDFAAGAAGLDGRRLSSKAIHYWYVNPANVENGSFDTGLSLVPKRSRYAELRREGRADLPVSGPLIYAIKGRDLRLVIKTNDLYNLDIPAMLEKHHIKPLDPPVRTIVNLLTWNEETVSFAQFDEKLGEREKPDVTWVEVEETAKAIGLSPRTVLEYLPKLSQMEMKKKK